MSGTRPQPDTRLLVVTAGLAIVGAGVVVALLLLVATGGGGKVQAPGEIDLGLARGLETRVGDGGPVYYPGTRGDNGLWLAIEHGQLVAVAAQLPGRSRCALVWKGSIDRFVDCKGRRHRSDELARYPLRVRTQGSRQGALLVDVRHLLPPPSPR